MVLGKAYITAAPGNGRIYGLPRRQDCSATGALLRPYFAGVQLLLARRRNP